MRSLQGSLDRAECDLRVMPSAPLPSLASACLAPRFTQGLLRFLGHIHEAACASLVTELVPREVATNASGHDAIVQPDAMVAIPADVIIPQEQRLSLMIDTDSREIVLDDGAVRNLDLRILTIYTEAAPHAVGNLAAHQSDLCLLQAEHSTAIPGGEVTTSALQYSSLHSSLLSSADGDV